MALNRVARHLLEAVLREAELPAKGESRQQITSVLEMRSENFYALCHRCMADHFAGDHCRRRFHEFRGAETFHQVYPKVYPHAVASGPHR